MAKRDFLIVRLWRKAGSANGETRQRDRLDWETAKNPSIQRFSGV